ncbi:small, acid-soluble spore protein, alpha/beta type [Halanaerobacter jeridensis]|uniref:Small acid-soluble spore protein F (Minor alpha/beta-type SASP) n=1 Tax=Halanaerobacter jeridensis TaxID=706427 RepID=A0A938XTB4_9FIRM|nr:small, acid-soluble spore protein, alpha/beta type [Halanaerobacter jeridensis]MBM7555926.1 small acid-soluble spore protein F (minor alpha/beta-type SASP) [Halanaerobacter jeridensis]
MSRIMSEESKYELAQELGFADKVKDGNWGNITTREAGSLVRRAIEKAEENMAQQRMQ